MRLLLVTQYFWPEDFGINALTLALTKRGVKVTVLSGMPNYPDGVIYPGYPKLRVHRGEYQGVETIRMPIIPRGKRSTVKLTLNYLSFIASGVLLGPWLLRRRSFDVVFVYAPSPLLQALPALLLARLKSAPLVTWVQDLWPESLSATGFIRNTRVLAAVRTIVKFIYQHTDSILIPSEAFREPINGLTGQPANLHYFPNAWSSQVVSDKELAPDVYALAADIASGFSVVFAGNLGTAQALDTVLDAAELLQAGNVGARFFLVGSGSLSDWITNEIRKRELHNVFLPGRFPAESMGPLYAAASALLVSLRDEPIFGYTIPGKVQGYLASGKPIIASINGEAARIVKLSGAGIACRAGDAQALADAVTTLLDTDSGTRNSMGASGCGFFQAHFSLQSLTDWLQQHLDQLVAQKQIRKYEGGS